MPLEIESPEALGYSAIQYNLSESSVTNAIWDNLSHIKVDLKLETHSTYVGPGHWFGMPDSYFRLGFGWASLDQMRSGLNGISRALDNAAR